MPGAKPVRGNGRPQPNRSRDLAAAARGRGDPRARAGDGGDSARAGAGARPGGACRGGAEAGPTRRPPAGPPPPDRPGRRRDAGLAVRPAGAGRSRALRQRATRAARARPHGRQPRGHARGRRRREVPAGHRELLRVPGAARERQRAERRRHRPRQPRQQPQLRLRRRGPAPDADGAHRGARGVHRPAGRRPRPRAPRRARRVRRLLDVPLDAVDGRPARAHRPGEGDRRRRRRAVPRGRRGQRPDRRAGGARDGVRRGPRRRARLRPRGDRRGRRSRPRLGPARHPRDGDLQGPPDRLLARQLRRRRQLRLGRDALGLRRPDGARRPPRAHAQRLVAGHDAGRLGRAAARRGRVARARRAALRTRLRRRRAARPGKRTHPACQRAGPVVPPAARAAYRRGRPLPPVFEQTALRTADPDPSYAGSHLQYDGGRMDGFFLSSGEVAIGYYTERELPFYYSLFDAPDAAMCGTYFCSILGRTWPNRFYLMSGPSGGITTNDFFGFGIFDSGPWPIILDLLEDAGVTWGIYNLGGIDDVPSGESDNVAVFWSRWAHDPRTVATLDDYLRDCAEGTLPAVSWLIPSFTNQVDEHPPADVSVGMALQQQVIAAFRASPLYRRAAFLLTYDEHGGFFDHVAPPQVDAYGLGIRVPLWVISPLLRRGVVVATRRPADHVSTLKLIERLHGLPTLASRNRAFDRATQTGPDFEANGAPAPPRDRMSHLG